MRWLEFGIAGAGLLLGAAQARAQAVAGPVELSRPWAAPAAAGADTSVMFKLQNFGPESDDLIRARCARAESSELVQEGAGGRPAVLPELTLGPGESVALTPGGVHVVLHHLAASARAGQTLHCTATFAKSGERLFEAAVAATEPVVK